MIGAFFSLVYAFSFLLLAFDLLDNFRNEERKDKQPYGKENLERQQFNPVFGNPHISQCTDEKGEDKGPDDDAQARTEKIVPKTYLGKAHTEIHGCEWKVEKPQVQCSGKSVPLNGIVIFLQLIPNQRGCKFSTQSTPN